MKRSLLLLILTIAIVKHASAQIDWPKYSQSFPNGTLDQPYNFGIVIMVKEENNSFWEHQDNNGLGRRLGKDTSFTNNRRPENSVAITTFDTSKAHFVLHGVFKSNANDYEYRVLKDYKEVIVPWSSITKFTAATKTKPFSVPPVAYLGGYSTNVASTIVVDVRLKDLKKIVTTAVVAWMPIKPVIRNIYTTNHLNAFLKKLQHSWATDEPSTLTYVKNKLILKPTDNNLIFYLSEDIYNRDQLEYELLRNGEVSIPWKFNDFDNNFVWLKELATGDFQLKIRYTAQRQNVTNFTFEVTTPWYQSTWFKIVAGILICAFLGAILSVIVNIRQKQQAEQELAKKTKLQLELKSIYAQLNPHFIFNALSSIQGLINKRDIKGANSYLSDFARLMRESLNNNNKDQTSLDKEVVTLDTYLKLEQLRFGFKYDINIDESINAYDTEIPSLLLQPLVENAVKHGVSALQDKGIVTIDFTRHQNNMLVIITDNGNGFLANANNNGFGLKLTYDRIKLLNEFTKGQPITFEVSNNKPTGAKIALTFNNWFL
ncbi:MAG: histidine kinase [Bacteroidota bacterium]|nr:histidine kinase [Bacteroidota bacterium]